MLALRMKAVTVIVSSLFMGFQVSPAGALAISVNFGPDQWVIGPYVAGVAPFGNWNDVPVTGVTNQALIDSNGIGTGITISGAASIKSGPNNTHVNLPTVGDQLMMSGYGYKLPGSNLDYTFNGTIPYQTFDIYVYYAAGTVSTTQTFSLVAGGTGTVLASQNGYQTVGTKTSFILSTGTNDSDYVKFTGLSMPTGLNSFILRAHGESVGGNYVFINGAQFVDTTVPEPSAIILLATGLLGLFAYAWRKRNDPMNRIHSSFRFVRRASWTAAALATILAAFGRPAFSAPIPDLFTAGNSFTSNSHYVSTTLFPWFTSTEGQVSGPWKPVEGRSNWTGTSAFWQTQIKQMMAANIDVLLVEMFPATGGFSTQRINQFQALHDLRAQGYNVPKVVPFLDTAITTGAGWTPGTVGQPVDLGTMAGKNAFVQQYTDFYNQYYSVNPDANADSYIAQIDGRVVLDSYVLTSSTVANVSSLTRADVQSRLVNSLGGNHALFNNLPANGIFMIDIVYGDHFSFEDERLHQFENNTAYYKSSTVGTRKSAQVMPGFWVQNINGPTLKREGGSNYIGAWSSVQAAKNGGLRHVNVESWNEYDEGTGIYAADPGPPYIAPGNGTNTDTWSNTSDPYEYIKTTADGARLFNDTPDRDATILWNNLPSTMGPGQTGTYQVVVRNDGDISWMGAAQFLFGENETKSDAMFMGPGRAEINDATNEIPTYGGIFRGRPITFNIDLTAPMTPGTYNTYWQMVQEHVAWFGEELFLPITVAVPEPSVIALLGTGLAVLLVYYSRWKRR